MNLRDLGCIRLISACIQDRCDGLLWTEFLRRYGSKIRHFVTGTLILRSEILPRACEESDLFQDVVLRLVENDCALMRAFSGTTEREWMAYLAVTTRSSVCDLLRRQGRQKRSGNAAASARTWWESRIQRRNQQLHETDRHVLAEEVRAICDRMIRNMGDEHVDRDILIFDLYFFHDLSIRQIAACGGVELSKTAVAEILNRLRHRVRRVIDQNLPQVVEAQPRPRKVVNLDKWREG